ncbi:hypothetical protein B0O80DRAFT_532786 [Mortierella sp. GBAus27b]|nr:hypothetical protein B0O80DRAFT_532786 [Mortierella sp. GBAus27b]
MAVSSMWSLMYTLSLCQNRTRQGGEGSGVTGWQPQAVPIGGYYGYSSQTLAGNGEPHIPGTSRITSQKDPDPQNDINTIANAEKREQVRQMTTQRAARLHDMVHDDPPSYLITYMEDPSCLHEPEATQIKRFKSKLQDFLNNLKTTEPLGKMVVGNHGIYFNHGSVYALIRLNVEETKPEDHIIDFTTRYNGTVKVELCTQDMAVEFLSKQDDNMMQAKAWGPQYRHIFLQGTPPGRHASTVARTTCLIAVSRSTHT